MSISKHIHSLQQHLARQGLQRVQVDGPNNNDQSEVFKICFLNKYELEEWKKLQETPTDTVEEQPPNALSVNAKAR